MAQPQALTVQQIQNYQNQIQNAGTLPQQKAAAIAVYQELYNKGYNYTGWALGVATGNTITGTAALDYLTGTALMGIDNNACRNLSAAQIDKIRVDMAFNTMEQMKIEAGRTGGTLTQDLKFSLVEAAHKTTFEKNNLSLSNWTLNTPIALYRKAYGDAAAEQLWVKIRDTGGGDGFDGVMASTQLMGAMGKLAFESNDPSVRQQALAWMEQVPGTANPAAVWRSIQLVRKWFGADVETIGNFSPSGLADAPGQVAADQKIIVGISEHLQTQPVSQGPGPVGLDSPTRNSAALINNTGAHTTQFNRGGGVDDLWVVEKNAGRYVGTRDQFRADFVASNGEVDQKTLLVLQGQTYYVPQRSANGETTYHYSSGVVVKNNIATGEYNMIVPNTDGSGGQTIHSRTYVGDVDGPNGTMQPQYEIRPVSTDSTNAETFSYKGYQIGRDGGITPAALNYQTDTERGSSSWAQGEEGNTRTDAVTNKATNATTISATDEATGQTQTAAVRPVAMTEKQYNDQMYSSMAGFLNALRINDKLGMALNGAKMVVDTAIYNNKGEVPGNVLNGANKTLAGISATVGIVAGLHALQSNDTQTQLNGFVGLVSSANSLAGIMGVTHDTAAGKTAEGFLSEGSLQTLQQAGALLSIANLRNLDKMLENGQVGSAFATLVGAINGFALLTSAGTGATALIAINPLVMIGVVFVLDTMFSKSQTPPPPPPVGWAEFTRSPQGLQYVYHGTTPSGQDMPGDKVLGNSILQSAMQEVLTSLNKQLTDANANIPDPSRALVTIASRLPKVFIQSWMTKERNLNGVSNYYYYLEMTHPQTGQKYGAQVARQDIVNQYTGMSMAPEAIVQQWQAAHLAAKFGADESKWLTEGQWAMAQSPLEQQRAALTKAYQDSYKALSALKNTELQAAADGLVTDGADAAARLARTQAIAAQQVMVDAAYKALVVFSTKNPLGYVGEQADAQGHFSEGIAPQAAAMVVDGFTQANLAALETTDPQAWQAAWSKARQSASQQWMKAITLDWNGDGQISKWMPTEIAAGSDTSANAAKKFNVGTMLKDLQSDGYARFDVDGDGYREVTEWVAASDALDFNRACAHRNASRSRIGFFDQGQLRRSNTHAQP